MGKIINIEVDSIKNPILYEQLVKIENKELDAHSLEFFERKEKIESVEDYLENLVKLDKAVNGNHLKDHSKTEVTDHFYDYREIDEYEDISKDYLMYLLNKNINKLDEVFLNLYKLLQIDLVNSYIENITFFNQSMTLATTRKKDITSEDKKGVWVIHETDNLSKIYYYYGLIKRLNNAIIKQSNIATNESNLLDIMLDDKFFILANQVLDKLNELCGNKEGLINEEFKYFLDLLLDVYNSKNKDYKINYLLHTLQFKAQTYLHINDNISIVEDELNDILLKFIYEIKLLFVNQYINNINEYKNGVFNLFDFNENIKYVINYNTNIDYDYWLNIDFKKYTKDNLTFIIDLLNKAKNITPYANKMYNLFFEILQK